MTKDEALKLALEALDGLSEPYDVLKAQEAIREALAQPEFPMHEEGEDGWSDFVCPDPKSYLMKCCDCGLVHEAQFKVVRYKSETEREDCEPVDDPNLQAVFRMRRSEQWSPKDTAYRPGGLAQPEQEPVAWMNPYGGLVHKRITGHERNNFTIPLYTAPPQRKPLTDEEIERACVPLGAAMLSFSEVARAIEAAHGIKDNT